jgi:hypothetical protein
MAITRSRKRWRYSEYKGDQWAAFWFRAPIEPIEKLAELAGMVFSRSEKRCPKWKFKLAPYLIVQVFRVVLAIIRAFVQGRVTLPASQRSLP